MLVTSYHAQDDTYDIAFMDGGRVYSVPRHLIATQEEFEKADAIYIEKKKRRDEAGTASDEEDDNDAQLQPLADTDKASQEAARKRKEHAKKLREANKKARELARVLEKHRAREAFTGELSRIRDDKPLHATDLTRKKDLTLEKEPECDVEDKKIGITWAYEKVVAAVRQGGDAEKAGVRPGWKLLDDRKAQRDRVALQEKLNSKLEKLLEMCNNTQGADLTTTIYDHLCDHVEDSAVPNKVRPRAAKTRWFVLVVNSPYCLSA